MTKLRALTVAGIMSGTSADGIDVAITRITPTKTAPRLELIAHEAFPFAPALRKSILAAMNAMDTSTAELAQLNWRLGIAYAEAVKATQDKHKVAIDLIGCHGQTLYHQPKAASYAGRSFACTWQAGEMSVLAQATGIPVVSNFRPADILAGGQGAPLVPMLDYVLFHDTKRARVLQNIGGIANLTAVPAGADASAVIAFDSGPGNMIIDALMQELFQKNFDRNGSVGARGIIIQPVLASSLKHRFFLAKPPRTAGREQFGREYASAFLAACRKHSAKPEDAIATATAFTAASIADAYARFVHPHFDGKPVDYIVSGGGARNSTLMQMLNKRLAPLDCTPTTSDHFGLPAEAKEAAAFALLAWQSWHHLPGNVPAATGAAKPVLLGQVTYA